MYLEVHSVSSTALYSYHIGRMRGTRLGGLGSYTDYSTAGLNISQSISMLSYIHRSGIRYSLRSSLLPLLWTSFLIYQHNPSTSRAHDSHIDRRWVRVCGVVLHWGDRRGTTYSSHGSVVSTALDNRTYRNRVPSKSRLDDPPYCSSFRYSLFIIYIIHYTPLDYLLDHVVPESMLA